MKRVITVVVTAMIVWGGGSALAGEGYGSAGCGLGSLLFGNQTGFVQVSAATTNGSTYTQLFGITSGTSNCEKQPTSFTKARLNEFVAANMDGLAKDIARGYGESLETLVELIGVPDQDKPAVYAKLQSQFSNIFTFERIQAAEVTNHLVAIING